MKIKKCLIKGGGGQSNSNSLTNTKISLTDTTTSVTCIASANFTPKVSTSKTIVSTSETVNSSSQSINDPETFHTVASEEAIRNACKKQKNTYNFNHKWLSNPLYSKWLLEKTKEGKSVAYSKICDTNVVNRKPALDKHMETIKHQNNLKTIASYKPIQELFTFKPEDKLIKRAKIKISAFIAEHNLPISLVDHLVPLMANIFPDSKIAQKLR